MNKIWSLKQLVVGCAMLNISALPLGAFSMFFIAAVHSKGNFLLTFLLAGAFLYGLQGAFFLWHMLFGKIADHLMGFVRFNEERISVFGIAVATLLLTIFFTIFADNCFALKRGDFGIYIHCVAMIWIYWLCVITASHIPFAKRYWKES